MRYSIFNDPWLHAIVDDVFDKDQWAYIREFIESIKPTKIDPLSDMHVSITQGDTKYTTFYETFHSKNLELFDALYGGLTESNLEKANLTSLIEVRFCGASFQHNRIHVDIPMKKMSNVLFVSPNIVHPTLGTQLYKSEDPSSLAKNIQWQSNRIFSFVAKPDTTWHDFGNPTDTYRCTVNMILREK